MNRHIVSSPLHRDDEEKTINIQDGGFMTSFGGSRKSGGIATPPDCRSREGSQDR